MKPTGFIGIGAMGLPMCGRLLAAGQQLVIWTRTAARAGPLVERGAVLCADVGDVFDAADTVILMLADDRAIDAVLGRGTAGFAVLVGGRTLVNMGTVLPGYSADLGTEIEAAGGKYLEAPVSGSSVPAESGALVAMTAGDRALAEELAPLFAPMIASSVHCGPVPNANRMKLAVNTYLGGLTLGLVEAVNFAENAGLDLGLFQAILEAGPMDNGVARMKLPKLLAGDFSVQGSVFQAAENLRMQVAAGREVGAAMPMADTARALMHEAKSQGDGDLDMVAVIRAYRARASA